MTSNMPTTSSKFAAFDVKDVSYAEVKGNPTPASVLVPKNLSPGGHPIMVRWHGGGFATGHRLFDEWMGDWILDLALANDAILVMPDYRLMPEASGLDILQDVHSFFTWLLAPENLQSHLPGEISPDLNNILVTGESAGGWLAIQSAFHAPNSIKAVIAHYPMLDLRDKYYTQDYEKHLFDPPIPQLDRSILRDFAANLRGNEVVTSAMPPARSEIFASMLQQGSFGKFFGDDSRLYPIEMLKLDRVESVPPTWILHGKQDSAIPIDGTYRYVKVLKEKLADAKVHLSYREGDHGFDNLPPARLDEEWVKEGVAFINQYWPE